jgi:aspartyl/asparaginyl beta-hydroxylase (cupin superfamily)
VTAVQTRRVSANDRWRGLRRSLLRSLNAFFDVATGGKHRPAFFDVARTCPALLALERNFPVIRQELLGILPDKAAIPRYHDVDRMQRQISAVVDPDKDWKVFYLYAMGEKPAQNRARCPQTAALLDRVPGLFQAFFSILDGGKSIPAHCGPYRGYLRYHLGLVVPDKDPPTIRIKDRYHTWQEGQSILFDDSWNHEVVNHSTSDRVVLIVDIRRPMPLPFAVVNRVVESVMRLVYGKRILKKLT